MGGHASQQHVGELGQALPSLLLFIPSLLPLSLLSIFDSPLHLFIPSLLHLFLLHVPTCVASILSSLDFSLPLFIPSLLPVYVYICPSKCSYWVSAPSEDEMQSWVGMLQTLYHHNRTHQPGTPGRIIPVLPPIILIPLKFPIIPTT